MRRNQLLTVPGPCSQVLSHHKGEHSEDPSGRAIEELARD